MLLLLLKLLGSMILFLVVLVLLLLVTGNANFPWNFLILRTDCNFVACHATNVYISVTSLNFEEMSNYQIEVILYSNT